MKILSWHCREINNPEKVQDLHNWCWIERPDFVLIMESMIDSGKLECVRNKCGFSNGFYVSSQGNSRGLGFWWRDQKVSLKSFSDKHISVMVNCFDYGNTWVANGIYGWADRASKYKTWDLMKSLVDIIQISYVLFGNFNEILSMNEKEGGAVRHERDIDAFRSCIATCNVVDLGYLGSCFT